MTGQQRVGGPARGHRMVALLGASVLLAAGAAAAAPAAAQSVITRQSWRHAVEELPPRLPLDRGSQRAAAPWSPVQSVVTALSDVPWYYRDPQLAASADARRAALAWRRGADVLVSTTADGGATWQSPVDVTGSITCGDPFAQPERIAASADGTRLAVVWLCESMGLVVHVATSTDAGATWSTPVALSEDGWPTFPVNPQISISADGSIVTAAWTQSAYTGSDGRVQVSRSVDGGRTWSDPMDVFAFDTEKQRVESLQSVVSEDGARVTLGWVRTIDYVDATAMTVSSADGGATWSMATALPQVGKPSSLRLSGASSGQRVVAIWPDGSTATSTVRVALSKDGGATWAAPVPVASGGSVRYPRITMCDDGTAAVAVWVRTRRGKPSVAFVASSRDGGETWAKPVSLSSGSPRAGLPQAGCSADGRRMAVTWSGLASGDWRAQVRTSSDTGRHWAAATALSPRGGDASDPQVAVSTGGGRAVAAWTFSTGKRVAVQAVRSPAGARGRQTVGGPVRAAAARWTSATTLFASPEGRSAAQSVQVATSSDGARLVAAWEGARYDDRVVWSATSADGGRTWSQPRLRSAIGVDSTAPALAASSDGRHAALAWIDTTYTGDGSGVVTVTTSADSGATWTPPVAVSPSDVTAAEPRLTVSADGGRVAVLWVAESAAGSDRPSVMAAASFDGGASWAAPATLATADRSDIFARLQARLAGSQDGSRLLATWQFSYDPNGSAGPQPVSAAVSANGGQDWSPSRALSPVGVSVAQHDTVMARDGSRLACAWSALVGERLRVQYVASTDLGQSWSAPTALSGSRFDASEPALSVSTDGRALSASWFAVAGGTESVQVSVTRDGGQAWSAARTLGSWPRRGTALGYGLQAASSADGRVVVAAWTRARGRARVVQAAVSANAGRSWGAAATLASSSSWADVSVDAGRSRVAAAWIRWTDTSLVSAATARIR